VDFFHVENLKGHDVFNDNKDKTKGKFKFFPGKLNSKSNKFVVAASV
jgi:hypothetical protein